MCQQQREVQFSRPGRVAASDRSPPCGPHVEHRRPQRRARRRHRTGCSRAPARDRPCRGSTASSMMIAIICTKVLTLPSQDTATLVRLPISAIHSRSAETRISRPTTTSAGIVNHAVCLLGHQQHDRDHDHQLVGHRVEEGAEGGRLVEPAREVAVEPVGHRGEHEHHRGGQEAPAERQVEHDHEHRDQRDAEQRQGVRDVHRSATGARFFGILLVVEGRINILGNFSADARHARDLLEAGALDALDAAEVAQQFAPPPRPHARECPRATTRRSSWRAASAAR